MLPWNLRRTQASLCMLFKIVHSLCFFPPNVITTRPNHSQATTAPTTICWYQGVFTLVCTTHTVHAWNLLPESVVNLPLQHFKSNTVNHSVNPVHNTLIAHCSCVLFVVLCLFLCLSPFNRVHFLLAYGYFVHPLPFA